MNMILCECFSSPKVFFRQSVRMLETVQQLSIFSVKGNRNLYGNIKLTEILISRIGTKTLLTGLNYTWFKDSKIICETVLKTSQISKPENNALIFVLFLLDMPAIASARQTVLLYEAQFVLRIQFLKTLNL